MYTREHSGLDMVINSSKGTKSRASYFLGRTEIEREKEKLHVGRTEAFFEHEAPGHGHNGQAHADELVAFIQAKWLIQPCKSAFTKESKLPIVVLDDESHRYKGEKDYVDKLAPLIWPVRGVVLVPVMVLPLDKRHSRAVGYKNRCFVTVEKRDPAWIASVWITTTYLDAPQRGWWNRWISPEWTWT